jgi:hypothetical protein
MALFLLLPWAPLSSAARASMNDLSFRVAFSEWLRLTLISVKKSVYEETWS